MAKPVTIKLIMNTGTPEPQKFVIPEIAIKQYGSAKSGRQSKDTRIYNAGVEARVRCIELVGVKNGCITPIAEPNSEPFLIMADKKRSGSCRFFASNGEVYYDIEGEITYQDYANRTLTKRVNRMRYSNPCHGTGSYRQDNGTITWKTIQSNRKPLTLLHQQIAKHVFNIFCEEKFATPQETQS